MSCTMWPTNLTESSSESFASSSHSAAEPAAPSFLIGARTIRHAEISDHMLLWGTIDVSLMVWIFSGNTLTILAIGMSRKLRAITSNWFVLALALSDLLVGFTLPYHLAFYMGSDLGAVHVWCLLRFFLIIIACCVSIWNLIAIAVDRYVAIVYPLHYVRYVTRRVAIGVMCAGWLVGGCIGTVPMLWNNWSTALECEFDEVLPPWYMVGVVTPLFSAVWLCMLALYVRIWSEAARQARQMRSSICGPRERNGGDRKSVQLVLLILGCFSATWLPYFIVACIQMFGHREHGSPTIYKATFSLAMANSAMNPMIYAWKNTALRRAFGRLLRGRHPDHAYDEWTSAETKRERRLRQQHSVQHSIGSAASDAGTAAAAAVAAAAEVTTEAEVEAVVRRQRPMRQSGVERRAAMSVVWPKPKNQSCCELDAWTSADVKIVSIWPPGATYEGQHRLMDILHIDAAAYGGVRATTRNARQVG